MPDVGPGGDHILRRVCIFAVMTVALHLRLLAALRGQWVGVVSTQWAGRAGIRGGEGGAKAWGRAAADEAAAGAAAAAQARLVSVTHVAAAEAMAPGEGCKQSETDVMSCLPVAET